MSDRDYDLIVLGAGSGGVRCARIAGALGAKVAVVESSHLGGTCVNLGCVPKKLYMVASRFPAFAQDAKGFGWEFGEGTHDWGRMVRSVDTELRRLNDIYGRLLENTNCRLLRGWGTLVDAHTVAVGDETVTADRILVCTGGWPWMPQIPGIELAITSNEVFSLPERPNRVVIVGTGYIGVEFACIFHGCGADVQLVNRRKGVLTGFDEDVRHHLESELNKQGIGLQLGKNPSRIEAIDGGKRVHLDDGTTLDADLVLFATGRRPRTQGLGLEALGVTLDERGAIVVDDGYQTSVPSIFAVGDVTDRVQLTPVALAEGMWLARSWFADTAPKPVEYDNIASAVFSRPNVATVGLTEAEARDDVVIYRSTFRALPHTLSGRDERSLLKLVVHGTTDRVLGAHMVGPDAGEVIQGIAIALKMGATKADFDRTIGIHPTVAEEFVTMRTPVS
ncbi:MAG: glutathione-disulfide reductase [Myxococcota bacterium]